MGVVLEAVDRGGHTRPKLQEEPGDVVWTSKEAYNAQGWGLVMCRVRLKSTTDPDLFRVYVEGTPIGSVREEPEGWTPIGAFILTGAAVDRVSFWEHRKDGDPERMSYTPVFRGREEAARVLVKAWISRLASNLLRMEESGKNIGKAKERAWRYGYEQQS